MFSLRFRSFSNVYKIRSIAFRTILSQAYLCDEEWMKRLETPLLKNIKMNQYFIETDKKFATEGLVSGVDIDLYACNVRKETELEELEHLLYKFRKTKRSIELMDSTVYAVVRIFLKYKEYESLFRILSDYDSYGIFPDLYSYNILMDTFLEEKMYSEAARIAILMMLQEDFSNEISQLLALYSCQMFLNECSLDSLYPKDENVEEEMKGEDEEEEDEVTLVRVPFLRNPWFDDHFNLENPKHLIGKTLYLNGREMNDVLGRTYQLIGLAMYEKWDKVYPLLTSLSKSQVTPLLLSEGVVKFKTLVDEISDDQKKIREKQLKEFEGLLHRLQEDDKIINGGLMTSLSSKLKDIQNLEKKDIELQIKMFKDWEQQRKNAFDKQHQELDKQKRLRAIQERKDYLHWKEKLLFFFENEEKNLEELKSVEDMVAKLKTKKVVEDSYMPPEIVKKPSEKLSIYKKLARVRKL